LHGRNEGRSRDALAAAAGAGGVVSGDLSTIAGARTVADEVNKHGRFDAVIHNAGIGYREGRVEMEPGVPSVFAVNVARALHFDGTDRKTEAIGLSELRQWVEHPLDGASGRVSSASFLQCGRQVGGH
jgi:NAD(P)-dependent dehydrogenase (short-subunit alcohol dehydrogenase family)